MVTCMNAHWLAISRPLVMLLGPLMWTWPRRGDNMALTGDWRQFTSSGYMMSPGGGTWPLAPSEQEVKISYQWLTGTAWHPFPHQVTPSFIHPFSKLSYTLACGFSNCNDVRHTEDVSIRAQLIKSAGHDYWLMWAYQQIYPNQHVSH